MRAALELFALNGYHGTSVDAIVRRAGVSKGLVYNYFRGKEELLEKVIFEMIGELSEEFGRIVGGGDARTALRRAIDLSVRMVKNDPGYWRLYWSIIMDPGLPEGIRKQVMIRYRSFVVRFEDLLRGVGVADPRSEALVLLPTLDALGMVYLLDPEEYPLERVKEYLIGKYCGTSSDKGARI